MSVAEFEKFLEECKEEMRAKMIEVDEMTHRIYYDIFGTMVKRMVDQCSSEFEMEILRDALNEVMDDFVAEHGKGE